MNAQGSFISLAESTNLEDTLSAITASFKDVFLQVNEKRFALGDIFFTTNNLVFIPLEEYEHDFEEDEMGHKMAGFFYFGVPGAIVAVTIHKFCAKVSRHLRENTQHYRDEAARTRMEEAPLPLDTIALLHGRGFILPRELIKNAETSDDYILVETAIQPTRDLPPSLIQKIAKRAKTKDSLPLIFYPGPSSKMKEVVDSWLQGKDLRDLAIPAEHRFNPQWPSPREYLDSFLSSSPSVGMIDEYKCHPGFVKQLLRSMDCYDPKRLATILHGIQYRDGDFFSRLYKVVTSRAACWDNRCNGSLVVAAGVLTIIGARIVSEFCGSWFDYPYYIALGIGVVIALCSLFWFTKGDRSLKASDKAAHQLAMKIPPSMCVCLRHDFSKVASRGRN